MTSEKASILLWDGIKVALGPELHEVLGDDALSYVATWPKSFTMEGELRAYVLKTYEEQFRQLVGELIPRAVGKLREVAQGRKEEDLELSTEDCQLLEDYLSWLSAQGEDKPDFEAWQTLKAQEKLAFKPTIYC